MRVEHSAVYCITAALLSPSERGTARTPAACATANPTTTAAASLQHVDDAPQLEELLVFLRQRLLFRQ